MMWAPTRAAIDAAERKVEQSRQNTRDSLRRARVALRATLARPSTLALVVGTAGVAGFLLSQAARRRAAPAPAATGVGTATKTTAAGIVLAYLVRYAKQSFPFVLQQFLAASRRQRAQADVDVSRLSRTGYSATGVRH